VFPLQLAGLLSEHYLERFGHDIYFQFTHLGNIDQRLNLRGGQFYALHSEHPQLTELGLLYLKKKKEKRVQTKPPRRRRKRRRNKTSEEQYISPSYSAQDDKQKITTLCRECLRTICSSGPKEMRFASNPSIRKMLKSSTSDAEAIIYSILLTVFASQLLRFNSMVRSVDGNRTGSNALVSRVRIFKCVKDGTRAMIGARFLLPMSM